MLLLWLMLASPLAGAELEYDVKAAYLYNFTTLVKWPAGAFANAQAPLVIGLVGRDPFSGGLDGILRGRKAGGRPIEVRSVRADDAEGLQACHMVFVRAAGAAGVARAVQGRPVLVVGEADDFAREGGMIGFVKREQRIKLQINSTAARKARLTISSGLLELKISEIVE